MFLLAMNWYYQWLWWIRTWSQSASISVPLSHRCPQLVCVAILKKARQNFLQNFKSILYKNHMVWKNKYSVVLWWVFWYIHLYFIRYGTKNYNKFKKLGVPHKDVSIPFLGNLRDMFKRVSIKKIWVSWRWTVRCITKSTLHNQ